MLNQRGETKASVTNFPNSLHMLTYIHEVSSGTAYITISQNHNLYTNVISRIIYHKSQVPPINPTEPPYFRRLDPWAKLLSMLLATHKALRSHDVDRPKSTEHISGPWVFPLIELVGCRSPS